jgi:hypothetical protein
MIYRIASNEWLKRVENMTNVEKGALAKRIEDWLKFKANLLLPKAEEIPARMMSVEQICAGWTSDAQDAFNEGVRLMTPFDGRTDTWLPVMIYTKAAKRCIHRIVNILVQQLPKLGTATTPMPNDATTSNPQNHKTAEPHNRKTEQLEAVGLEHSSVVPRPKHIDQYIHLLPEETQTRAANYGQLMKELGTARTNMRLLLEDSKSTATAREQWAKIAVALDKNIGDLRKELDAEWNKLTASNRISVDMFGVAHILEDNRPKHITSIKTNNKNGGLPQKSKKESAPRKQYTEEEKNAHIKYLQKWLRDPRPAATPEHKNLWQENAKELIELGGELTKSMLKTGEHYKAKIPK